MTGSGRRSIGPYECLEIVGRGGMGVVYSARHGSSGRIVALKTVKLPHSDLLEGLRREIHALARLDHPGVVRIVDDGVERGIPWYAMDLVNGVGLLDYVRGDGVADDGLPTAQLGEALATERVDRTVTALAPARPGPGSCRRQDLAVDLSRVVGVARRLCDTLAFMHGEGVVHRDLKPDNVLVDGAGHPVIVDFGLMTSFAAGASRERLDVTGGVAGTPAYMAPEQIRSEVVDARADLYALGCILFELLSGRPPFVGESQQAVLSQHVNTPAPRLSELVRDLPEPLDELVGRLLAKEPRARLGFAVDVGAELARMGGESGRPGPEPKPYLYRPGLAGRSVPFEALARRLDDARGGSGGALLMVGESGVGKTRLVTELAAEAVRMGFRIVAASAASSEPLHGLRPLLRAMADHCRLEAPTLLGEEGAVLAAYEPALADLLGGESVEALARLGAEGGRLRLFVSLGRVARRYATDRPLLVVLDDLQWADELTLGALEHFERTGAFRGASILFVATARAEEIDAGFLPGVGRTSIGTLEEKDVALMVRDMLALPELPAEFVAFLATESRGNPFFVAEYLRSAVASGGLTRGGAGRWQLGGRSWQELGLAATLQGLVEQRLAGVDETTRRVLEAAAVLGRAVTEPLLRALVGMAEPDLHRGIGELTRRHLLEDTEGTLRFAHDRIREVAYGRIDRPVRLHRRAAEALDGAGTDQLGILGRHWKAAGEPERAAASFLGAAKQAARRYAHAEAARLYRAYFEVAGVVTSERVRARLDLVSDALNFLGRMDEAIEELRRALVEAEELADPALRADAHAALAWTLQRAGRMEEAGEQYQLALELRQHADDDEGMYELLGNLGSFEREMGRAGRAEALHRATLELVRKIGRRDREGIVLGNLAGVLLEQGRLHEARAAYLQALSMTAPDENLVSVGIQLANLAGVYVAEGKLAEAGERLEQALHVMRRARDVRSEGITLANLASVRRDQGQVAAAMQLYEQALAANRSVGDRASEGYTLTELARCRVLDGELEQAAGLLAEAMSVCRGLPDVVGEARAGGHLARVRRYQGRLDEAREIVEAQRHLLGPGGPGELLVRLEGERGHIALAAGGEVAVPDVTPALARAVALGRAGKPLVWGECPEDVPEWLRAGPRAG